MNFSLAHQGTAIKFPSCSGISNILHKSVIEVTKEGTERRPGRPGRPGNKSFNKSVRVKEVIVDKPFIFVLEDTEHNIPLLVGRVVSPLA